MKTAIVLLAGAVLAFSGMWSNPAYCDWEEVEVAVTFVFSGIFEGQDLVLENVYRSLTGPFIYPSEMEMIESIPEIPCGLTTSLTTQHSELILFFIRHPTTLADMP